MFNVQSEGLHGYDFFKEIVQNYELLNEAAFGGGFLAFTRRDTDLRVPTCGSQRGMKYSHKDAKSTKENWRGEASDRYLSSCKRGSDSR